MYWRHHFHAGVDIGVYSGADIQLFSDRGVLDGFLDQVYQEVLVCEYHGEQSIGGDHGGHLGFVCGGVAVLFDEVSCG